MKYARARTSLSECCLYKRSPVFCRPIGCRVPRAVHAHFQLSDHAIIIFASVFIEKSNIYRAHGKRIQVCARNVHVHPSITTVRGQLMQHDPQRFSRRRGREPFWSLGGVELSRYKAAPIVRTQRTALAYVDPTGRDGFAASDSPAFLDRHLVLNLHTFKVCDLGLLRFARKCWVKLGSRLIVASHVLIVQ